MPTFQTPVMVLMQEKVAGDMLGRIFSLMQIVSTLVMMLASAATGGMIDAMPIEWIMMASGVLLILLGGAFMADRPVPEGRLATGAGSRHGLITRAFAFEEA